MTSDFDEQYGQYKKLLARMEATQSLKEKHLLFKDLLALLGKIESGLFARRILYRVDALIGRDRIMPANGGKVSLVDE